MRAAIYNPYLDTLGGGERYSMAVALVLAKKGYSVDVEWKDASIKRKLEERFGIKLEGVSFIESVKRGDGYDVCFWVSDGSIPALKARKNFLHFQVPFHDVNGRTLINRMKLFRVSKIICNSFFTKKVIDKEYGVESVVIYPPVSIEKIKPKRKENIILFVGRFSQLKQSKNQDVLIEAFKKFYNKGNKDWKLVLAGGTEVGGKQYLEELRKSAKYYPVEFMENPSFKIIADLYGRARVFWSAVGYGAKENEPEKVEHFGITVIEAMAGGVIPLVFDAGGYKETVEEGVNGYRWNKITELVSKTQKVISKKSNVPLTKEAIKRGKNFSYEVFSQELTKYL